MTTNKTMNKTADLNVDLENQRVFPETASIPTVVRLEPCHRRLRARFAGQVIVDTTEAVYLMETGHLPVYYFPRKDVRFDLLVATDTTTHCPHKGDASYWSIVVGDRTSKDAVWGYSSVIASCPDITDYVAFYWDRVEEWFEEDEEVFVHARNPYTRVDVLQSSRHVQVKVGGVVVADTHRPRLLFETNLPVRYYIPKLDVRMDLMTPTDSRTKCPYKGKAVYWSATIDGRVIEDIVWGYPAPIPEIPKIENHLCFYNERVDEIIVDGVVQPRPVTKWSPK